MKALFCFWKQQKWRFHSYFSIQTTLDQIQIKNHCTYTCQIWTRLLLRFDKCKYSSLWSECGLMWSGWRNISEIALFSVFTDRLKVSQILTAFSHKYTSWKNRISRKISLFMFPLTFPLTLNRKLTSVLSKLKPLRYHNALKLMFWVD